MSGKKDVVIPLAAMPEGIKLALERAATLLEDARTLAEVNRPLGVTVLFSQGVEEFGKAAMLKEALDQRSENIHSFKDHDTKLKKAAEILPPGYLMVFEAGFDADEFFDADIFFGGTSADEWAIRLDWLYVNWDRAGAAWRSQPKIDNVLLTKNIANTVAFVKAKQVEWCT